MATRSSGQEWPLEWIDEQTPLNADNLNLMVSHIEDNESSIVALSSDIDTNKKNIDTMSGILASVTNDVNNVSTGLSATYAKAINNKNSIDGILQVVGQHTSTISNVIKDVDELDTGLSNLASQVRSETQGLEVAHNKIDTIEKSIGELDTSMKSAQGDLLTQGSDITSLKQNIIKLEDAIEVCEVSTDNNFEYIKDLRSRVDVLESSNTTPGVGIEVYTNAWFKTTAASGEYDNNTSAASVKFVQSAVSKHGIDDGSID